MYKKRPKARDLHPHFPGSIPRDGVAAGNPSPDVFRRAAQTLGPPPENIVVFEDSLAGIEAGIAGGLKVVAAATTNPAGLLPRTRAHCVVNRLTEVSVGLISALLRS